MLRMLCVAEHSMAETKGLLRSGFAKEWQRLARKKAGRSRLCGGSAGVTLSLMLVWQ